MRLEEQLSLDLGTLDLPITLYLSKELKGEDRNFTLYSTTAYIQNGTKSWCSKVLFDVGTERFVDLLEGLESILPEGAEKHMNHINEHYTDLIIKGYVITKER